MKKRFALFLSALLIGAGLILSLIGLLFMGFDFEQLDTSLYQTNTHEVTESFDRISVKTDTADVHFALSQDGVCRVVCFEEESTPHSVAVKDGVLEIRPAQRQWYEYIKPFHFKEPLVTVFLTETAYAALEIETDTGDIAASRELSFVNAAIVSDTGDVSWSAAVSDALSVKTETGEIEILSVSPKALSIESDTGDVLLRDGKIAETLQIFTETGEVELLSVECGSLALQSDTGDVELQEVLATGVMSIVTDTGDVELDGCDAASLSIVTDTGDVSGSLRSEKVFVTNTSTGDVRVPSGTSGGICDVKTSTGDIEIRIKTP